MLRCYVIVLSQFVRKVFFVLILYIYIYKNKRLVISLRAKTKYFDYNYMLEKFPRKDVYFFLMNDIFILEQMFEEMINSMKEFHRRKKLDHHIRNNNS